MTPQMGDRFRLDGFEYVLTSAVRRWNEDGTLRGVRQCFQRPLDLQRAESPERRNYNYKRAGECNAADLVWYDAPTYHAALAEQAREQRFALSPHTRIWAEGAVKAQHEFYAHASGCWGLAGRHLIKPPLVAWEGSWRVVACHTAQEAYAVARRVLTGDFYLSTLAAAGKE